MTRRGRRSCGDCIATRGRHELDGTSVGVGGRCCCMMMLGMRMNSVHWFGLHVRLAHEERGPGPDALPLGSEPLGRLSL